MEAKRGKVLVDCVFQKRKEALEDMDQATRDLKQEVMHEFHTSWMKKPPLNAAMTADDQLATGYKPTPIDEESTICDELLRSPENAGYVNRILKRQNEIDAALGAQALFGGEK